jgi:hypothetical protein
MAAHCVTNRPWATYGVANGMLVDRSKSVLSVSQDVSR